MEVMIKRKPAEFNLLFLYNILLTLYFYW